MEIFHVQSCYLLSKTLNTTVSLFFCVNSNGHLHLCYLAKISPSSKTCLFFYYRKRKVKKSRSQFPNMTIYQSNNCNFYPGPMTSPEVFQNYSMRHEIPSCEAGLNFNHEAVSTPRLP